MKNKIIKFVLPVLLTSLAMPLLASCGQKSSYDSFIDSVAKAAGEKISRAKKVHYSKKSLPRSAYKSYPKTYDLRHVDTNLDGVYENYVTGVKFQNPFGTCWAFGTIAAAESSILFDLKQDAVTYDALLNPRDSIDLSEHQLGWFTYTVLPDGDPQAGEGLTSMVAGVEANPSLKLNSGSTQFAGSKVFASGIGPVQEPSFYEATSPMSQLNYHGKRYETTVTSKGYPIYSKEDDWSVDESLRFKQTYMLEDSFFLPEPNYFFDNGKYDLEYADLACNTYKEQLMNGRAVSVAFSADNYSPDSVGRVAKYINTNTWAHYCYEPVSANHVVTVVGWDDNYSKNNFLSEVQKVVDGVPQFDEHNNPIMIKVNQPPKDGAWIVKNSWGALDTISDGLNINKWGFEGSGYFYLSYYDLSLITPQCFDFDVTGRLKDELGEYVLEEHDLMPCEYPFNIESDRAIKQANVFKAEQHELIRDISCMSNVANEETYVSIYKKENGKFDFTKPITEFEVNLPYPGYHVLNLDNPIELNKDEEIAICLLQKAGNKYLLAVNGDYNLKGFLKDYCEDQYYATGIVNKGESYLILDDNTAIDFADAKQRLETMDGPTSFLSFDNFPIKAYASIIK